MKITLSLKFLFSAVNFLKFVFLYSVSYSWILNSACDAKLPIADT